MNANKAPVRQLTPLSGHMGILMSDLRGFTALTERYPILSILPLLDRYFAEMSHIIDGHGGRIDKFMGDSILALFDLQQDPDAAYNMLSCAIDMQVAMDAINAYGKELELPDIYMGIALNAGEIVACELGSDIYREFTVLGEPVNVVARMAAFALRGQVLMSEQVFAHCRGKVETGADFNLLLKGKKQIVKVFELQALLFPEPKSVPLRENRRSPRVEAFLPAAYHCLEGNRIQTASIKAEITDLSYGGMRIATSQQHQLLDEIKIVVPFAMGDQSSSDIYAKVLSCSPVDPRTWCISVEFTWLDEFARKSIRNLVDNLV